MSAKDTVVGTAKQIVAEIVGDGKLAEEGARQANGSPALTEKKPAATPSPSAPPQSELSHMDENRFAALLGHAALKVWAELPRDAQERLFTAAVDDGVIANELAEFLHDRHPKTAHPPQPTRLA
jgi:hypothetical protein